MVKILFLGRLADAAGQSERDVELPNGIGDVDALRTFLGGQVPALLDGSVRTIVNDVLARAGQPVGDGDEVAFFPPVSGG